MPNTTSKTYRGRNVSHTYGQFAADAARALPEGWLPVSLDWVSKTLLDVIFERPTAFDIGEDEPQPRTDRWQQVDRPSAWHLIQMVPMDITSAGIASLVAALLVTQLLRV